MDEITKLIQVNVLRDVEIEIMKGGKSLQEVIKDLEIRYRYYK